MTHSLYCKEDIAKAHNLIQSCIDACEIQGAKPGQAHWYSISDKLTEALGFFDAGKDVTPWQWKHLDIHGDEVGPPTTYYAITDKEKTA